MKTCEKFQKILAAYSPDPAEIESDLDLAEHLGICPDCRAELESYRHLSEALKALPLPDPGELFFQSQFRHIEAAVRSEAQAKAGGRRWWMPSLALAAAVVLLFISFARWRHHEIMGLADWKTALSYLAEEGSLDSEGGVGLDELSSDQLDRLATNMEHEVLLENSEGVANDESVDWNELSGPELDRLLQRLQASTSRSRS